jgi:hypothetical protein
MTSDTRHLRAVTDTCAEAAAAAPGPDHQRRAARLALDAALDPWERQPAETPRRFAQFAVYRDAGRARTLRKTADALALNSRHVRAVAAANRWVERAEAYDRHLDRLREAAWVEQRRQAAEDDARVLDTFARTLADRLDMVTAADLTPVHMIRALDVVMRHRRALFGDPGLTVAVTGPGGDPLAVQMAEFAGMTTEERRAALGRLAATVQRRAEALTMGDDEEPAAPAAAQAT